MYLETFLHFVLHRRVFHRISGACVRLPVEKVEFCKDDVEYVGLYISHEGLQPRDSHKNHIIQCSFPQAVKTLPCAIIAESSFPMFLELQDLYKSCSGKVLVEIF